MKHTLCAPEIVTATCPAMLASIKALRDGLTRPSPLLRCSKSPLPSPLRNTRLLSLRRCDLPTEQDVDARLRLGAMRREADSVVTETPPDTAAAPQRTNPGKFDELTNGTAIILFVL